MYWGRCISGAAYNAIQPRLVSCPHFCVPVFREKGLFNVVTNFDRELIGVVPLGEWQKKQDSAQVHMTIQFFTELARSKDLVLVRCEIKDTVFTRQDCLFVTQMLLKYYTYPRLYEEWVETFNKRPHHFDYHRYLRTMKEEAEEGKKIEILDKKSTQFSKADNYGPSLNIPSDLVTNLILNQHKSLDTSLGAKDYKAPSSSPSPASGSGSSTS
jgi:hypothetical protein